MRENTIQNRLKLYKMFFGVFASFDDFCAVLERCTQNYECLMLDNTLQTNAPTDCIFWYKAKLDNGDFRLGRDVFYQLEAKARRTESLSSEQALAEEETSGKRGKAKLVVSKEESGDE